MTEPKPQILIQASHPIREQLARVISETLTVASISVQVRELETIGEPWNGDFGEAVKSLRGKEVEIRSMGFVGAEPYVRKGYLDLTERLEKQEAESHEITAQEALAITKEAPGLLARHKAFIEQHQFFLQDVMRSIRNVAQNGFTISHVRAQLPKEDEASEEDRDAFERWLMGQLMRRGFDVWKLDRRGPEQLYAIRISWSGIPPGPR